MFPYFLLLSTCCVLLLPYIFTLPSPNIFAGGCTPERTAAVQIPRQVWWWIAAVPVISWYRPLATLHISASIGTTLWSGPRPADALTPHQGWLSTFYVYIQATEGVSAGDTRHAAAGYGAGLHHQHKLLTFIRAPFDVVWLLTKNIYKARISIFFTTTKYPSVLLLVTRDRTYYGLVTPSYIANLL